MSKNILEINNLSKYFRGLAAVSDCILKVKKVVKRQDAQKYITSLFLALSEDAVIKSQKYLKYLVKNSQTFKGLNKQGLKEMTKKNVYKSVSHSLNSIYKRLNN